MSTPQAPAAPARGLIALLAVLVGKGLMVWGLIAGIDAALDGGGSGAFVFMVIFIVGAALVLVATPAALVLVLWLANALAS